MTPHLGAATVEAQLLVAQESAQLLVDYLTKGQVRYAVNMVALDRAELEEFAPWIDLSRRLGLLSTQMARGAIKKAELHFRGEIASKPTRLMTSAFAAGLLENHLESVNIVNARVLAAERGLEIVEQSSSQKGDFSSLIKVVLHTDTKSYTVSATTFGNQYLRLVQIGHYKVDVPLDGVLLVFSHQDVPGLIGTVGNIMGQHGINIGGMNVGRETQGGEAIGVLNLDAMPPEAAVKAMLDHPKISSVSLVKLPPVGVRPAWLA
jgi:D-3-phosphoglycerate dehydrogenase